jgi:hypothetical protein
MVFAMCGPRRSLTMRRRDSARLAPTWRRVALAGALLLAGLGRGLGADPDSASADAADALPLPAAQDRAALERNLQTARWMMAYDRVAWITSELLPKEPKELLAKVSPIWFCLQRDGVWYAFYGRLLPGGYDVAACYREKAKDTYEKVAPPKFPEEDRYAMAINLTEGDSEAMTRSTTVRFNDYIRTVGDRIEVYYLPAFQSDGMLAYGVQYTYVLDAQGQKVIQREVHGSVLIGARPGKTRTIALEMPECAVPTPQALFTMMSYRDAFADIVTLCRRGYFGIAKRNGELICVRASAPAPGSTFSMPGPVQTIAPPPRH